MPSPQRVQWAKFRSAVVAVVAVAILSVLVYLLSGGTWLKPKTYLTTYIPDSTGVDPGADVQLNGVLIGKVESVHLTRSKDPNRVVEVRLKIVDEFLRYIPDDSLTEIDSVNLLGDQYIDILMGKSAQSVRPNGELPYRPPSSMMPKTSDLAQFDVQLRTIDQTIMDIQSGKGPLGQFVVSDTLYQQFVDGVIKVEKEMRAATGAQSQLGQALHSSQQHEDLRAAIRQLDDRLAQVQANRLLRDTSQYDQIRGQLAQVRNTLADLNAGKGAGGELLVSDAAYTQWNRLLAGWIQDLDALNAGEGPIGEMVGNAQTYESLNGTLRQFAATVKDFREHPQRFLRIKLF
jgi:phospholipid/cholesterol/gamma-HCH transport system substrate-binding protein